MEHTVSERSGITVVKPAGPIDVSQALDFRDLLGSLITGAEARVLVDLSEVTLIDSSAIGVLVTAHRRADGAGAAFALAGASGPVARVFDLTRTNKLLKIYPTVDEGVQGLAAA